MRRFDVCNGDADGLCAVVQWRLHDPAPATLVTGLKREIALLERVPAGDGERVRPAWHSAWPLARQACRWCLIWDQAPWFCGSSWHQTTSVALA